MSPLDADLNNYFSIIDKPNKCLNCEEPIFEDEDFCSKDCMGGEF